MHEIINVYKTLSKDLEIDDRIIFKMILKKIYNEKV